MFNEEETTNQILNYRFDLIKLTEKENKPLYYPRNLPTNDSYSIFLDSNVIYIKPPMLGIGINIYPTCLSIIRYNNEVSTTITDKNQIPVLLLLFENMIATMITEYNKLNNYE
jgi:hypothetical protein